MLNELKNAWKDAIEKELRSYLSTDDIPALAIGLPPRSDMGDAAFPMFPYSKLAHKAPAVIASDIAARLTDHPEGEMLLRFLTICAIRWRSCILRVPLP